MTADKSWITSLIYVDEQDKEFYVGELARTQSEIKHFILDQGLLVRIDEIFILIKAVLAVILKETENNVMIGIGVPVSTSVEKMKELSAKLKGEFHVKIKNDATNDVIERIITIKQVLIMPEAYGSYYYMVSKSEEAEVIDAMVISLDLLTEILVIYNGNLIRNASRNLTNASLFVLSNKIANALQQQIGLIINPHSILKNIRENRDQLILGGKTYDIEKIKEHYIRQISNEIVDNMIEILSFLPLDAQIDYFILSGEALDLFWTEIQMLILENNLLPDFDMDKIIVVKDPIFANAIGFELMVKKRIEKESSTK